MASYYGSTFGQTQTRPPGPPPGGWNFTGWPSPAPPRAQPIPGYYGSTAPYAGTIPTTPTPTAPTPAPAAPPRPSIDFGSIDYSNDPILARVRALAEESISQAQAQATADRTRLAIGYGDPELAKTLKLGGKTQTQAEQNPFGTLQELNRGLTRRNVFDINRPLSDQANLFYSTERGRQLALSGEQFLRDKSTAWNAVQDRLSQISAQVQAAKMAAQAQIIQAEQQAYQTALQQALYSAGVG
jgi:hypothetical protein